MANFAHADLTIQALKAGKHVLCEKPMVLKKEQAKEVFRMAEENRVVLMEAVKTAYCPGFNQLLSIVRSVPSAACGMWKRALQSWKIH